MLSTNALAGVTATLCLGANPVGAHWVMADHNNTIVVDYCTATMWTLRTADAIGPASRVDNYNDAMVSMLLSADQAQIVNAPEDEDEFMEWVTSL